MRNCKCSTDMTSKIRIPSLLSCLYLLIWFVCHLTVPISFLCIISSSLSTPFTHSISPLAISCLQYRLTLYSYQFTSFFPLITHGLSFLPVPPPIPSPSLVSLSPIPNGSRTSAKMTRIPESHAIFRHLLFAQL